MNPILLGSGLTSDASPGLTVTHSVVFLLLLLISVAFAPMSEKNDNSHSGMSAEKILSSTTSPGLNEIIPNGILEYCPLSLWNLL